MSPSYTNTSPETLIWKETSCINDPEPPLFELIKFKGLFAGRELVVLKDDGCNTNVVSKEFYKRNASYLNTRKSRMLISRSEKSNTVKVNMIILDTEIKIDEHRYRSNWDIAKCRYDALLGIPWHVDVAPSVSYKETKVNVGKV